MKPWSTHTCGECGHIKGASKTAKLCGTTREYDYCNLRQKLVWIDSGLPCWCRPEKERGKGMKV